MLPRDNDRDRALEQLLRQSVGDPSAPPGACVDGETLAAWTAGALRSSEAAAVESHVADCARCQAMLATFARTAPVAPVAEAWWRRWNLRWLVPVATAATVAAIWVALPNEQPRREGDQFIANATGAKASPEQQPQKEREAEAFVPAPDPAAPSIKLDAVAKDEAPRGDTLARQNDRPGEKSSQQRARAGSDQVTAPSAAPPAAVGAREERMAAAAPPAPSNAPAPSPTQVLGETVMLSSRSGIVEIVSPDSSHRWRIGSGRQVQHSITGGAAWQAVALPSPDVTLTAGHSPASSIAWLVGRRGVIVVTTDGSRFEPVPFVEVVDLVSVRAIDDRQATVTVADGRTFRTTDRGETWVRGSP